MTVIAVLHVPVQDFACMYAKLCMCLCKVLHTPVQCLCHAVSSRFPHTGALSRPSLSHIGSPHHFCAQGVEKFVVEAFDHPDVVVRLADLQAGGLFARLAPPVDRNQKTVAAAFHIERDFPVVTDDDGADVEAVWRHGRDGYRLAVRHHDGAAYAERVGRGSGRCGNHQPVCQISDETGVVDGCMNGDHGRAVPFQYGYFVQSIRFFQEFRIITLQLQDAPFFHRVVMAVDFVECLFHFCGRDVGQKPQPSCVDAQDGDAFSPDPAGSLQEGSVSSDTEYHVGAKVITVKQFGRRQA